MSLADIRTSHTKREFLALLVIILICGVLAELATRFVAMRISKVERTIDSEREAVAGLKSDSNYLLIVGNSLLQEGTDIRLLNQFRQGPDTILRYAVAQTQYVDWEYGLKALWQAGLARGTVLLMMSPEHFASSYGRADYAAMRLVDTRDLLQYTRDLGQHPTEASRTVLSHFSHYFGFRNELRKNIIGRLVPGLPEFMNNLATSGQSRADLDALAIGLGRNLDRLKTLATTHHARVALAIPPLISATSETELVCEAAKVREIPCLTSQDIKGFGPEMFRDGFHLNARGASIYSSALVQQLNAVWQANGQTTDTAQPR